MCPRCLGAIPTAAHPGKFPGALSRTDNKTEICSDCGVREALEHFSIGQPMPQQKWGTTSGFGGISEFFGGQV